MGGHHVWEALSPHIGDAVLGSTIFSQNPCLPRTSECDLIWKWGLCRCNESRSHWVSQVGQVVKNPPANAGEVRDIGLIPALGRSLGGGHGYPLQYSCLGNPMNRGAWQATVHRVAKGWT